MEFDLSQIKLSRKDKEKGLVLPKKPSKDLAYISGVLAGDGSIYTREYKKDYIIKCVGNPKDEISFYHDIISPIFHRLFGLKLNLRYQDSGTTYGFIIYSKTILEYLTKTIGLPCGKKYKSLKIPIIFKENAEFFNMFIQGLADTDFSLVLKRGSKRNPYYPVIVGSSKSYLFMKEVSDYLVNTGFKVTPYFNYILRDKRFKKGFSVINRIELCGHNNFKKWIEIIGFRHPKNIEKIKKMGI